MANTSCVSHATKCWWWKFHLDYFAITGHDHCAASLLYAFEFLTSQALDDVHRSSDDVDIWLTMTKLGLSNALTGLFSERSCYDALKKLDSLSFIVVRHQTALGETKQYRFNYTGVSEAIDKWAKSEAAVADRHRYNCFAGKIAYEVQAKLPTTPQAELPADRGQNCLVYKEEGISSKALDIKAIPFSLSEDQKQLPLSTEESPLAEQTPLSAPAELCDKNYFLGKTSSYELQLDTEVCQFVKRAYVQRKGREIDATGQYIKGNITGTNHRMRPKIEEAERKCSAVEFRLALWCYLDTDDAKLRDDKWPLNYFLKEPLRYLPEIPHWPPSDRPTQSPRPIPAHISPESPENVPALLSLVFSDPLKNPLTYISQWNTIVYDSSVDVDAVPSFTMAGLKKAINGGDFQNCFERVYEKCQRMNANKPGAVTFDGLFMGYVPMWQEIYAGKHDWKIGKEDPFASVLAAAEREERGDQ